MSDETPNLDPDVIAALRAVAPADDETRERHLAVALSEVRTPRSHGRIHGVRRLVSVAAASVVLVGIGFGVGVSMRSGSNAEMADAGMTASSIDSATMPAKGSMGGTSNNAGPTRTATESRCSVASTWTFLTTYQTAGSTRFVYVRMTSSPAIIVMDDSNCSVLQVIDLP